MRLPCIPGLRALAAFAIAAGLLLGLRSGLGPDGLMCMAPALALAATLFGRRYPGERLLRDLARGDRRSTRLRLDPARPSLAQPEVRVPRGGLLMAFALAVRPPPASLLAS